jgi:hypothetical protein
MLDRHSTSELHPHPIYVNYGINCAWDANDINSLEQELMFQLHCKCVCNFMMDAFGNNNQKAVSKERF